MLTEKYRPETLDAIIGQNEIISKLKAIAKREDYPHMLFTGPSGVGKTTSAQAFAREIFGESWRDSFIDLNASDERGIDVVREKIKRLSHYMGKRILFLDECDAMTDEAQDALRRIIEESRETIFILAANKEYKIIVPIRSRCAIFRFKTLSYDEVKNHLFEICRKEGIKFKVSSSEEQKKILEGIDYLIKTSNGDLRYVLNTFETLLNQSNTITCEDIIALQKPSIILEAVKKSISGDFEGGQKMLEDAFIMNGIGNLDILLKELYESLNSFNENILKREVKIRLHTKLADLEYRCKMGLDPLIQIGGFLSYCWYLPHATKSLVDDD